MRSSNRPVSVAERRARLAARHHLAPGTGPVAGPVTNPVADAVTDIIGLHGTDPASVYLSAWTTGTRPVGTTNTVRRIPSIRTRVPSSYSARSMAARSAPVRAQADR